MNAQRYKDQILIQHFIPFYKRRKEKYDEGVVIIEDGARYYYTALYKEVKDEHGVKCINHLAQSSDLNYIKNLQRINKVFNSASRHKIKNSEEMAIVLEAEWLKIKKETLNALQQSMPRRIEACLEAKGVATKY